MQILTLEDIALSPKPAVSAQLAGITSALNAAGIPAYLVGGFVRDLLLERHTADVDIAVAADALQVAQGIAARFGAHYVELDSFNRISRVVFQDIPESPTGRWYFDFSTMRGSIEEDLSRRDFTVNSMALPLAAINPATDLTALAASALIDPCGGRNDLLARTIRATTASTFQADPARLIRAVRLAAELDFMIDSLTASLIKENASLIAGVAGERVREELLRILNVPEAGRFLKVLDRLGLLTAIMPELAHARGVEQPVEHYWDVFEHSLQTVAAAGFLLRQDRYDYAGPLALASVPWSPDLQAHFNKEIGYGSTQASILKIAALLHDVAKPQTKFVDDAGRTRFFGHNVEGASIAATILERLRFSAREIKMVDTLIRNHLRPGQMSHETLPSRRAIYRFFRDTGPAGIDVLFLSLADHLAARGPTLDLAEWERHTRLVAYIIKEHQSLEKTPIALKLIDGHDLIELFGIKPGPEVGRILEAVREAQAAGDIVTREQALQYAKKLIHNES